MSVQCCGATKLDALHYFVMPGVYRILGLVLLSISSEAIGYLKWSSLFFHLIPPVVRPSSRVSGMPMPAHVSVRPDDLETLMSGLIGTYEILREDEFDVVLMATVIAFGFVLTLTYSRMVMTRLQRTGNLNY